MEEWNNKFNKLKLYYEDLVDLARTPDEWTEAHQNGYVELPYTEEGVNMILFTLQEELLKMTDEKQKIINNDKKFKGILTEYMFITINPDPKLNISVLTLYNKFAKLVKSKCISDYLMTFEQRGESVSNIGYGPHIHFILRHKYRRYCELRKHISGLYRECVGNDNAIDIRHCKGMTDVRNRVTYIIGDKQSEEKRKKQEIDKIWKQEKNIEEYYGNKDIAETP